MGVAEKTQCEIGRRCHINGRGLQKFGSMFTQKKVSEIASSSVQLVFNSPEGVKRLASGTLIHSSVVLCAAHSLDTLSPKDITERLEIHLLYEFTKNNAPPGDASQYADGSPEWATGKLMVTKPQARGVRILEIAPYGLDCAMIEISWLNAQPSAVAGQSVVRFPRPVFIPRPSTSLSRELLMVGHPYDTKNQGEPTQASAGRLYGQEAPSLEDAGDHYGYAAFGAKHGFSGGGVFNADGKIVGVLIGGKATPNTKTGQVGTAFLQLGKVLQEIEKRIRSGQAELDKVLPDGAIYRHSRMRTWMRGENAFSDLPQVVIGW